MTEFVAARCGTIIANDPSIILAWIKAGREIELLSRERMQLMADFDLGPRWERLAAGPTLFEAEIEEPAG